MPLKEYFRVRAQQMEDEKSFMHAKIDSWLDKLSVNSKSSNAVRQKKHELIDLAKFIYCFDKSIVIVDGLCEKPDFIIAHENKKVGVELIDLISQEDAKEKEGFLRRIFNQIEIELKEEDNNYNGIYRIEFVSQNDLIKQNETKIKTEIIQFIKGEIQFGGYVQGVRPSKHTDIHLYTSNGSVIGSLKREIVESKIEKKEAKYSDYSNEICNEIWLLLVIGGVQQSDDYSMIEENILNVPFNSKFHRIFILNFFKSIVLELEVRLKY